MTWTVAERAVQLRAVPHSAAALGRPARAVAGPNHPRHVRGRGGVVLVFAKDSDEERAKRQASYMADADDIRSLIQRDRMETSMGLDKVVEQRRRAKRGQSEGVARGTAPSSSSGSTLEEEVTESSAASQSVSSEVKDARAAAKPKLRKRGKGKRAANRRRSTPFNESEQNGESGLAMFAEPELRRQREQEELKETKQQQQQQAPRMNCKDAIEQGLQLYEKGDYANALSLFEAALDLPGSGYMRYYGTIREYRTASDGEKIAAFYNAACCHCKLNQLDAAMTAIQNCVNTDGFKDYDSMEADGDLEPIRNLPQYKLLVATKGVRTIFNKFKR